jgi:hypothetical protein
VRGSVAFARRRPPLASQPSANEMVLGKKAFEIFMSLSYIVHGSSSVETDQAAFSY